MHFFCFDFQVKLDLCIADLNKVKALETPYLKQLSEDFPTGSKVFKGHNITKSKMDLKKLIEKFSDALIANLLSR